MVDSTSTIREILTKEGLPIPSGTNRWYCPLCDAEKLKSKSVKFYDYMYKCFRCGAEGNLRSALELFLNFDFQKAYRITKPDYRDYQERVTTCKLIFSMYLRERDKAKEWLLNRGYPEEAVSTWEVGFAPSSNYLRSQGVSPTQIALANLDTDNGKELYYERVVFPIYDRRGNLCYFQARSTNSDSSCKWLALNNKKHPNIDLLPLSSVLYNAHMLEHYKEEFGYVFLCEGLTDAFALKAMGFPVIATFGIQNLKLTSYSSLFKGLDVIACYDNDVYPLGSSNAGIYKSWHVILPQLGALYADEDLNINIYTFSGPKRSGIKDIFDLALELDWNAESFKSLIETKSTTLVTKALEVYGSEHIGLLINSIKYAPCSKEEMVMLEKLVSANGGWLKSLRD